MHRNDREMSRLDLDIMMERTREFYELLCDYQSDKVENVVANHDSTDVEINEGGELINRDVEFEIETPEDISEWTRERIIEESKKYSSRSEFAVKSQTAYHHACEDKTIFAEMPWLIEKKKPNGWWDDKDRVMEEGRKYKSRSAFANGSYSAWKIARRTGWIDEMIWFEQRKKS